MKILVLGASGMLGHAMVRVLAQERAYEVFATARSASVLQYFPSACVKNVITGIDVENTEGLIQLFSNVRPNVVINCIGLIKQLVEAGDPLRALPINAMLPHRLARLCELVDARLVHISTDCVFSGRKGNYLETDEPDAQDLYGRSKLLGEVVYPHAITLRTSIIGHELTSANGLIGWFLSQNNDIKGFTKAIFSGLPTCELSRVVRDFVLPNPSLYGLYHVATDPISKYDLLQLANREYGKGLRIEPDSRLSINRSLDARKFRVATGYAAPAWEQLVAEMHTFQ